MIQTKFNRLLVLSKGQPLKYKSGTKNTWVCQCDCGNITTVITSKLKSGAIKSCGCLKDETNRINSQTTIEKRMKDNATLNIVIGTYKYNALARDLEFELTPQECENLFQSNCHYCGSPPSNIQKNRTKSYVYSGIDRIDNTLGYFPQNVVPCCKTCNKAKGTQSYEDFKKWINNLTMFNIERLKHELKQQSSNGAAMPQAAQSKNPQSNMQLSEYLALTNETAIYPEAGSGSNLELYYLSLGLVSEAGEVAGKVKKLIRDGKLDVGNLAYELGDCFWYLVRLCDAIGYSPEDITTININKLLKRKDNGTLSGSGDNR